MRRPASSLLVLALMALMACAAACGDEGDPNPDPWNLDDVEAPVFVDASAAPGGDGTLTRPYVSLAEGLLAVADGGELVVAEGRYAVPGRVTLVDTVRIRGAGAGLTVLAAGVEVGIDADVIRLSDLDLDLDAVVDADEVDLLDTTCTEPSYAPGACVAGERLEHEPPATNPHIDVPEPIEYGDWPPAGGPHRRAAADRISASSKPSSTSFCLVRRSCSRWARS